jgi:rSAM/selenodomain-associated transferase 1
MTLARHLVVFTRYPRLGTGKRRLARDIGAVQALRFQRMLLDHLLLRLARDPRWTVWLAMTPGKHPPPRLKMSGVRSIGQGPGDLGDRMGRVARALPPGPVVIIGSDIPGIRPEQIAKAFRALGHHDAVFGPATDGGYWLVGLKRRPRFLDPFADVRWSTAHALADTRANLAESKIAVVSSLSDVDDGTSLKNQGAWWKLHNRERRG